MISALLQKTSENKQIQYIHSFGVMAKAATRPEDCFNITAFPVFEQTERGALYERSNYPGCKHAGKEQQHRKRIAWLNAKYMMRFCIC